MIRTLTAVALLLCLAGCNTGPRDQAVANQGASVFEMGVALEKGASPAHIAAALKASGAGIIHAMGFTYAPAAETIKALTAKESP